jgi:hypothetical protein
MKPTKRKAHKNFPLKWVPIVQYFSTVIVKDKRLTLALQPTATTFIAVALETDDGDDFSFSTPNPILPEHAHHVLGKFATEAKAKKACLDYAKVWVKAQSLAPFPADACPCDEIKVVTGYGFCPNCGADNPKGTSRERRPNGYTKCGNCKKKTLSSAWSHSI